MNHLDDIDRIHVTGLESGRMAAIARILADRGYEVTGSADRQLSTLSGLEQIGVDIHDETDDVELGDAQLVVHPPGAQDSREVAAAGRRGIDTAEEAALLAEITAPYRTIAVTGTHGRGTVSSMIAWMLQCAGRDPGFVVNSRALNFGVEGRDAAGRWFVLEVDERLVSHRSLECDYVVCNFLDLRPRTYYAGRGDDDIVDAIREFIESNRRLKESFANLDCRGNREVVRRAALRPTGYSLDHSTEFRGDVTETDPRLEFEAYHRDDRLGEFSLEIPGRYNVVNALGAVAVALRLGVSTDIIADALSTYQGLANRYRVSWAGGVTIVKDFARHPAGVERLVESARRNFEGPLIALFDPAVEPAPDNAPDDWAAALEDADEIVLAAGGDRQDRADQLVDRLRDRGFDPTSIPVDELDSRLLDRLEAGDNVLFVGGEQLLRRADHLQAEIAEQAGRTPPEGEQPRFDGPLTDGEE